MVGDLADLGSREVIEVDVAVEIGPACNCRDSTDGSVGYQSGGFAERYSEPSPVIVRLFPLSLTLSDVPAEAG